MSPLIYYSNCKALIGSKLAAFFAGYTPKKIPMIKVDKKDIITTFIGILSGQSAKIAVITDSVIPQIMPIAPPLMLNNSDSVRN